MPACALTTAVCLIFFPLCLAPLVDTSENHSSSAMLMLLSVVVVGLAVFLIYKFKRYCYPFLKPQLGS